MDIAIIGAGLAGLHLANQLSVAHTITVFEKARGPGGRMSTRRATPYAFDHGAQYFTATSNEFRTFLTPFLAHQTVAPWPEAITLRDGANVSDKDKYCASPGMNAICKLLAAELDLRTGHQVERLERKSDGWYLHIKDLAPVGPFDWVISSAPAPQTTVLFPETFSSYERLTQVEMLGCFSLMLGFDAPLSIPWSALKSEADPVGWIAVNSAKPGRDQSTSILVQSRNTWAEAHLESDPAEIKSHLLHAASELSGLDLSSAIHQVLHRWRYAATKTPVGQPFVIDEALQLAACGDWCLGSKVEAAFLSADALAKAL